MLTFKSMPLFYFKEESGVKPNTVRIVEKHDTRYAYLNDCEHPPKKIKIVNAGNPKLFFVREITDISYWSDKELWIISFKHKEDD